MKKHLLFAGLILCLCTKNPAQNLPVFNVTILDTARSSGVYFLSPLRFGTFSPNYPVQLILDNLGRVLYMKRFPSSVGGTDFKLQPNGLISYNAGLRFFLLDSLFHVVDTVRCKHGLATDVHDLQVLPNGHFLLLGSETVTMNLSSYNMFNHNGSPGSTTAAVKCGVVQELDAAKNVVFEWHAKDHYLFDDVDEDFLGSPSTVDWTHFNAVEMDTDGNILVSVRHFNEITKINRSDSTIIWRFGGKQNQFLFTNDTAMFKGQHDIRRINNGHVTLFDNGENSIPLHPAAAKEYLLNETAHTATLVWSYTENPNSYSGATGNVQRLPGANTLVDYGNLTNANLVFNVVDSAGTKIFEISFPDTTVSFRSFNYPALPWSLPRPVINCTSVAGQFYLDAGPGYSSYLWSTGDTTQTIAITAADTFNVFVPLSNGDYISSEYLIVTNITNPCGPLAIPVIDASSFMLFPDPAGSLLHVSLESLPNNKHTEVSIYDLTGRILMNEEKNIASVEFDLDVSSLSSGIYLLKIDSAVRKFVKQ